MARKTIRNARRDCTRWSEDENQRLLRQVKAFPQNLHKCFLIVGEEIGRTDKAVAAHWYSSLSKREDAMCFFTASPRHVSKNRKNGMGVETSSGFWRSLMSVFRRFHL